MEKRIKFVKAISNDYVLMLSIIAVGIGIVFILILSIFGFMPNFKHPNSGVISKDIGIPVFSGFLIIFIPLFFIRLNKIKTIIRDGELITGKIKDINFFKDRGRITVEYTYEGEVFEKGIAIMKTKGTNEIKKDEEKVLIVNKYKPAQFLIVDFFCE